MSGRGKCHGRARVPGRGLWLARAGLHFLDPVLVTGRARKVAGDYFTARIGPFDEVVLGLVRGSAASTFGIVRG